MSKLEEIHTVSCLRWLTRDSFLTNVFKHLIHGNLTNIDVVVEGAVGFGGDDGAAGVDAMLIELAPGRALPWPSGRRLKLVDPALIFIATLIKKRMNSFY